MWAAKRSRVSKNSLKMNYEKFHDFIIKSDEFWGMLKVQIISLFYFGPTLFPAVHVNGGSWYKRLMIQCD